MSKRNLLWLAVIAVIALGFYRLVVLASQQDSVYRTYAPLVEVDALIRQRFVEPIEDDPLVDGAIRGMMLKLDPYSGYIAPEELSAFRRRAAGKYIGIGIHLGIRDGRLTVIAPIEQSPAVAAGVQAGDVVLAIDGASTDGAGVADADHLLSGDPGSRVSVIVRHAADGQVETLHITRAPIRLHSVKGFRRAAHGHWDYLIDHEAGISYVRVSNFHENTITEFDRALEQIRSLGAAGLVLDLRFNPGGALRAAVAMVDRFVRRGLIVSTVTRHQAKDLYQARVEGTYPPVLLAVLINGSSASASEIVAGSLQDHGRAVIVGSRSFGKGVVQNVVELSEHNAAISLTVAHYRLPNGRIIHRTPRNVHTDEWGVQPDLVVEITEEQGLALLARRLEVDRGPVTPETAPADHAADPATEREPEILLDDQLAAALAALREQLGEPDPS
ncbi:MAG: S41 family peptidase [Planctomycetota bacterium]|jgi:carboxyl-terminal processing protease